jgi:hypothetical protein
MPAPFILAVGAMALVVVVLAVVVVAIWQGRSAQEQTGQAPRLIARLARRVLGVCIRRPDLCVISEKHRGTGTAGNAGDDGLATGAGLRMLFGAAVAPWSTRPVRPAVRQAALAAIAQHMFSLMLRNVASDGFVFAGPSNPGSFSLPGCVIAPPLTGRSERDEPCLLPLPV